MCSDSPMREIAPDVGAKHANPDSSHQFQQHSSFELTIRTFIFHRFQHNNVPVHSSRAIDEHAGLLKSSLPWSVSSKLQTALCEAPLANRIRWSVKDSDAREDFVPNTQSSKRSKRKNPYLLKREAKTLREMSVRVLFTKANLRFMRWIHTHHVPSAESLFSGLNGVCLDHICQTLAAGLENIFSRLCQASRRCASQDFPCFQLILVHYTK